MYVYGLRMLTFDLLIRNRAMSTTASSYNEIPPSVDDEKNKDLQQSKPSRRKRRWGDAPPPPTVSASTSANGVNAGSTTAAVVEEEAATVKIMVDDEHLHKRAKPLDDRLQKAASLQQSIAARLAMLKQQKQQQPKPRAKVYDLDFSVTKPTFQQPAVIISTDDTKKQTISKPNPYLPHPKDDAAVKDREEGEEEVEEEVLLDGRLAGGRTEKRRVRFKPLTFIEPGTFEKIGEKKRLKAALAEKSGFSSGRKEGSFVKAIGMASGIVGSEDIAEDQVFHTLKLRVDEDPSYSNFPIAMEWWDAELLPPTMRKELAAKEKQHISKYIASAKQKRMAATTTAIVSAAASDLITTAMEEDQEENDEQQLLFVEQCFQAASLGNVKTSTLVQHPPTIQGAGSNGSNNNKVPVLHMTKQEMKRQRKLRRAEKQRTLQDMQAAGLIPPPEPRLTLSNFMRVLGDQAVMDPSQMEAVVMKQVQARKLKHEQMNKERQLTPAQKKEKRARKLYEDTSNDVHVALFLVKDMSHRYHRTKVDLNAQQNSITGGVLECQSPTPLALIIAEGGPKAIKRYIRLMTVRMKWKGENLLEEGEEESSGDEDANKLDSNNMMRGDSNEEGGEVAAVQKFNPNNSCQLVWTGMAVKRMFKSFVFQTCATSDLARKVLEAKGVAHYWDQVITFARGSNSAVNFKLLDRNLSNLEEEEHSVNGSNDEEIAVE